MKAPAERKGEKDGGDGAQRPMGSHWSWHRRPIGFCRAIQVIRPPGGGESLSILRII
jgi:hypothetical protein